MNILVLDPAHCLALALAAEAEERLDIDLTMFDGDASLTLTEAELSAFDAVIVPPLAHLDGSDSHAVEAHAEQLEALLAPCREANTALVWCVSDEIYEFGYDKGAIEESLIPSPESPSRRRLVAIGDRIRAELAQHLIIRVGPLFGLKGRDARLPGILEALMTGIAVSGEENLFVGPTPVDALARGLCGMLLQLDNGADAWGPYHLSGIEPVSDYIFVSTLRTQLIQLLEQREEAVDAIGEVTAIAHPQGLVRRVLNCRHMLGTFGVHQKPWRLEAERMIERWLDLRLEQSR
ncbi:sugar nucleotide-binding protein [Carnimonas bestiolae]|uniref:sugar nucleotide-binding protein n=1 Tax=Carnimonas bestiolae TaxID=3402172 RepID=UPI003EDC1271